MKSAKTVLLISLATSIYSTQARAFCFLPGSGLCAVSCRGDSEAISPELVKSSPSNEQVCALELARDPNTLDLLLKSGVDIDSKTTFAYKNKPAGRNALFRAISDNRASIVTELIANHIDVNAQDQRGSTPLMLAVLHGRERMVDELLQAGAQPCLKDRQGKTALTIANESLFGVSSPIVTALKTGGGICDSSN